MNRFLMVLGDVGRADTRLLEREREVRAARVIARLEMERRMMEV